MSADLVSNSLNLKETLVNALIASDYESLDENNAEQESKVNSDEQRKNISEKDRNRTNQRSPEVIQLNESLDRQSEGSG